MVKNITSQLKNIKCKFINYCMSFHRYIIIYNDSLIILILFIFLRSKSKKGIFLWFSNYVLLKYNRVATNYCYSL
jgi:hypothetical protein